MRSRLQSNTSQQGFTLIELVVVIVILGILAVTAAPRFIDLTDDARTATLEGVAGSLESAGSLIFAKALIAGNDAVEATASVEPEVTVPSGNVKITFGYPRSNDATAATALENNILDLSAGDFEVTWYAGTIVYIEPAGLRTALEVGAGAPTACFITYTEPTAAGNRPAIAVNDC